MDNLRLLDYFLMQFRKNIVLTGGNSGIGLQIVKALYARGHNIIFASRNQQKSRQVLNQIQTSVPSTGSLQTFRLDLSQQVSIQSFVRQVNKQFKVIDILINNAGVCIDQRQLSEKGIEMMMAVNYLGHFYLTYLLFPLIKLSPQARIINVSSLCHKAFNFATSSDLGAQYDFSKDYRYSASKLAVIQFTYGLALRIARYPNIKTISLSHSAIDTLVLSTMGVCYCWVWIFYCCWILDPDVAANGCLFLSTTRFEQLRNGQYYQEDSIGQMNQLAYNQLAVERLWSVSEKVYGIIFRP